MRRSAACHQFMVDLDPIPDGLIRLLSPFAAQQARVVLARHDLTPSGARAVLRVAGLERGMAELLDLRLKQLPFVRDVQLRTQPTSPGPLAALVRLLAFRFGIGPTFESGRAYHHDVQRAPKRGPANDPAEQRTARG